MIRRWEAVYTAPVFGGKTQHDGRYFFTRRGAESWAKLTQGFTAGRMGIQWFVTRRTP